MQKFKIHLFWPVMVFLCIVEAMYNSSAELVERNCLCSQVTDGARILIPERSALDAVHRNSSTAAQTSPSIQLMELYHLRK